MRHRLWELRQAQWERSVDWTYASSWTHDDPPDFAALARLYRLDADAPPSEQGDDYNVYRIVLDGVPVRFVEESHAVHALVEGRLAPARLAALRAATLATLQQLAASAWEIEAE